MDLSKIDPELIALLKLYAVPGGIIGSLIGIAIAARIGGGWSALAELARAILPWNRKG